MKKMSQKLVLVCALILMASFGGALFLERREGEGFLERMAAAFSRSPDAVPLKELTDFPWQEVCIFLQADSAYYSAYDAYVEYIKSHDLKVDKLRRQQYKMIFLFKGDASYKQIPFMRGFIEIDGKEYWPTHEEGGKPIRKSVKCLKGDVHFKRTDKDYLLILSR